MDENEIALWLWNWLSYGEATLKPSVTITPESDVLARLEVLVKKLDINEADCKDIARG